MSQRPPQPIDLVRGRRDWREELQRDYEQTARRLAEAYARVTPALRERVNALVAEYEALAESGQYPTPGAVRGLSTYGDLLARIELEMRDFAVLARNETAGLQERAVQLALPGVFESVAAQLPDPTVVSGVWMRPDPEALTRLIGYVDSEAMRAKFAAFGENAAQNFADGLLSLTAQGKNPVTIARWMRGWYHLPYSWAENMARTTQLYSYRSATHASYKANERLLDGWMWRAALDVRTCFPAGTLIRTDRGDVPIEQIRLGDRVLTHTGKYQRVTETMRRDYSGEGVTLAVGAQHVTMTADHPVLLERNGVCDWVAARDCKVGDLAFLNIQEATNKGDHRAGRRTIEWSIRHTQDAMPSLDQSFGFSPVTVGALVPVYAVDFKHQIAGFKEEIDRIAIDARFLLKRLVQSLKATAHVSLRLGFAGIAPVASRRAELLMCTGGNNAKLFAARQASVDDRRASAKLRAVCAAFARLDVKRLAAAFTNLHRAARFAFKAAIGVSLRVGRRYRELFATARTGLCDAVALNGLVAGVATVSAGSGAFALKSRAADFTDHVDLKVLRDVVTGARAVFPGSLANPSGGDGEMLATGVADSFNHTPIISSVAHHIQCEVYNLEVETDHTYVANGLLVHNCMSCVSQHGSIHSVNETLNDHHQGRCAPVPVVKGTTWAQGVEAGRDWYGRLPEAVQRRMAGNLMFVALRDGAVQWDDLSRPYKDDVFGEMLREASVVELVDERRYLQLFATAAQLPRNRISNQQAAVVAANVRVNRGS